MKEYIFLLWRSTIPLSDTQTQQLRQKWGKLITWLREEEKFVEGYIFSDAGHTITGSPERMLSDATVVCNNMWAAGCMILRSEDIDEALLLAQLCPVLDYGGAVEVRERIPQPQPAPVV